MESRDEKDLEKAVKLVKNRRATIECVEGKEKWREREREVCMKGLRKKKKKDRLKRYFHGAKIEIMNVIYFSQLKIKTNK